MMRTETRKRLIAGASALALLGGLALSAPTQASADEGGGQDKKTTATYAPSDGNKNNVGIECSWALEDVDSDWDSNPKMTYKANAYWGDSTPNVKPNPAACDRETSPGNGTPPSQSPIGQAIHIDVLPNSHDLPTEQYVELWSAVDTDVDPDSTTNPLAVRWEVRHPDGTLKFQVIGTRYEGCAGPVGMFSAAIQGTGQITQRALGLPQDLSLNTMTNLCQQGQKHLYYGAFPISKHQPWGTYKITAIAEDDFGDDSMTYNINVLPFFDLRSDFSTVDFEGLSRNAHERVLGDFLMNTPEYPTVVNRGNTGVTLELEYTRMCKVGFELQCDLASKNIDRFDAGFGVRHDLLVAVGDTQSRPGVVTGDQGSNPKPDGFRFNFAYGGAINSGQQLCPNDRGKVEFSLYTDSIETGTYRGDVSVFAVDVPSANEYCPTDNGSVYFGDFPYNQYRIDPTLISNTHWGLES